MNRSAGGRSNSGGGVVHIGPLNPAASAWRARGNAGAFGSGGGPVSMTGSRHYNNGSGSSGSGSSSSDSEADGDDMDSDVDDVWHHGGDGGGSSEADTSDNDSTQREEGHDHCRHVDRQGASSNGAPAHTASGATERFPQQQQQQQAGGWDDDSSSAAGDEEDAAEGGSDEDSRAGRGPEAAQLSVQAARRALDATLPFFDTAGVTVSLSEYGLIWNQLHAWITPATRAYVRQPPASEGDAADAAAALQRSAEQQDAGPPPPLAAVQQRAALVNLLVGAAPAVLEALQAAVPPAQLNKQLVAMVRSFRMAGPLPALQTRQWQLLLALLLGALSAWRLPVLQPVFVRPPQQPCAAADGVDGGRLAGLLQQLGSDVDRFWSLMHLFGDDDDGGVQA
jgi:hypothetical protein